MPLSFLAAVSGTPSPVVEFVFAGAMVSLGLCAWLWIMLYRHAYRQLGARHPEKYAVLWGSAQRRKNSIDRLSAFLQFLLAKEDKPLKDGALSRTCLSLKLCSFAFFLCFLVMAFSPMFLPAGR